jgi:hypothetical protein
MAQITFVIPARNLDTLHRTLSMLSFQKDAALSAVIVDLAGSEAVHSVVPDFEHRFPVSVVTVEQAGLPLWKSCLDAAPEAEWVCFLLPGVEFNETTVKRMNRCIDGHDSYDAFRWNLAEPHRKWKRRTRPDGIFTRIFVDGDAAPLSSFVFRAQTLRAAFGEDSEAAGMAPAVILTAAKDTGVRTVRRERIGYTPEAPSTDPSVVEKEVRSRLAFFRWSERYFGEEYPMGIGDRLDLFATELARLYPSYTQEELKEDLGTFAVVNGPVRRLRAASALKSALKARQEALKTPKPEA